MMKINIFCVFSFFLSVNIIAQKAPDYSTKEFSKDTKDKFLLKKLNLANNEHAKFVVTEIEIWDVDDDNTTHVKFGKEVKICFVSDRNEIINGVVKAYIFLEPEKKPIKIWEQTYKNGKLNGKWSTFNLQGTLVSFQSFKDNLPYGVSRTYQIDGKEIIAEVEIRDSIILEKEYYENGNIKQVRPYINEKLDGEGTQYYEDGTIMEKVRFLNGQFHGLYIYYYSNGQKWIEIEYNKGIPWTVFGNYLENGEKRDCGTLKNGDGTLIYYNEDGTINEVDEYKNGMRAK